LGQVIPFSELDKYLQSLEEEGAVKGTILDTNVLISATYDVRDSYSDVLSVWETLQEYGYELFATVSTRSEYLEFYRRLTLTEALFDIIDDFSTYKISSRARAKIQTLRGSLKTSVLADSEKDEVFNDIQLKKIKKEFSAGNHSGQKGWLEICDVFLRTQVARADQGLIDSGIKYISPNDPAQAGLFNSALNWSAAVDICEKSGTAFSDSMILNALKSSKLFFVVTLDFDIAYAALSDPNMKDVVVPDRLYKEFKKYHFPN